MRRNLSCRLGRRSVAALVGVAGAGLGLPAAQANDCTINDDHQTVAVENGGIWLRVFYREGDCSDVTRWLQGAAVDLRDAADSALSAYRSLGYADPFQTGLPDYKMVADPTDLSNAHASLDCATFGTNMVNNQAMACDPRDEQFIRMVAQHEMFHHIQLSYWNNVGDGYAKWGDWVTEGTARYMQDKLFNDLDFSTYTFAGFSDEIGGAQASPEVSLVDRSYRACLFWCYLGERLGGGAEPSFGSDVVREFFDALVADGAEGSSSALGTLADVVDSNGSSLDQLWLDHSIANFAKDYFLLNIPEPYLYDYVDENQAGEGVWASVATTAATMPSTGFTSVAPFSARYFEANVDVGNCTAIGFRGESNETVGWALLALNESDQVVALSKGIGADFGRAILTNSATLGRVRKLVAVVAGLEASANVDFWLDQGAPDISIYRPDLLHPAYVNVNDSYRPFLIRLEVDGPTNLKPEGAGDRSILGLGPDDFEIKVDGIVSDVVSSAYVGQYYWVVAAAPSTLPEGVYDLSASLCGGAEIATNANAVLISDIIFNHVLVLDQSGSMGEPETGQTKLEAAKIAAGLYTQAVSPSDRVALFSFNGNNTACDDDATRWAALKDATDAQKDDVLGNLAGLTPDGMTSIGDGLWDAQDELVLTATADEDIWKIILLSDGAENEARFWNTAAGCSSASSAILGSRTVIEAIAFGPDADQELMQTIAASTGGEYSYVDTPASQFRAETQSMANELSSAYIDSLQNSRQLEKFFDTEGSLPQFAEVFIPITEDDLGEVLFYFNVGDGASNLSVKLFDPNGQTVGNGAAKIRESDTNAVFFLNNPPLVGTYRAELTTSVDTDYIAGVLGRDLKSPQMMLALASVPSGAARGNRVCDYEQGVPVIVTALVFDDVGPIPGLTVDATIERPDGGVGCSKYRLFDDGAHQDGLANDGVYAFIYTETALAGGVGVMNDPGGIFGLGLRGSYQVQVAATGRSNSGEDFTRYEESSFQVCTVSDFDNDGLVDSWERYYGLNPLGVDTVDPDLDGLTNAEEFDLGTHPFNTDTDGDGETDSSEPMHGRCPTNPDDLVMPAPVDVAIVDDTSDAREPLPSNGVTIRFPWHNTYAKIHIERKRAADLLFTPLTTVEPTTELPIPLTYFDASPMVGDTYEYRVRAETFDGGLSRYSRRVQTVFFPDCNANGIDDVTDIAGGTSDDCDANGIPDECDVGVFNAPDANGNGTPDVCECLEDINGDGQVNLSDLGLVLANFGGPGSYSEGDINGDGQINLSDLGLILSKWGACI